MARFYGGSPADYLALEPAEFSIVLHAMRHGGEMEAEQQRQRDRELERLLGRR